MHLFGDTAFVSNSCKDQMVRLMPMWQERGTRPGHTTMRHYILLLNTVWIVSIVNHCKNLSPPIFACNHRSTQISNPKKEQGDKARTYNHTALHNFSKYCLDSQYCQSLHTLLGSGSELPKDKA